MNSYICCAYIIFRQNLNNDEDSNDMEFGFLTNILLPQ